MKNVQVGNVDECWLRWPFPTGVLMMMYISASFEAKVEEGKEE